mgnify:CR=1 FL=1
MSKKSRRRNRKILGALGALGALALAGRRRRNASIEANEAKESGFDIPVKSKTIMDNMPKKKKSVYQDPIMTGGKGVKQGFKTTSANVQRGKVDAPGFLGFKFDSPKIKMKTPEVKFGQVKDKKTGEIKTLTPFKSAGLTLGGVKTNKSRKDRAVELANKQMAEGMLPPQLRSPGRTNITTRQGENRRAIKNFFNLDGIRSEPSFSGLAEGDFAAKDGGRITKKGVKRGAAKRGFGRAYIKGRK